MLIQSYIKCIPQLILCPMISFYRFLLLVFTFLFPGFNLFDVAVFLIFKFYLDCLLDFQYLTLFRLSTSILASNLILISIKIMPNKSDAVLVPTGRYVIVSRTGISEKILQCTIQIKQVFISDNGFEYFCTNSTIICSAGMGALECLK